MHRENYDDSNPLAYTIELCDDCHYDNGITQTLYAVHISFEFLIICRRRSRDSSAIVPNLTKRLFLLPSFSQQSRTYGATAVARYCITTAEQQNERKNDRTTKYIYGKT